MIQVGQKISLIILLGILGLSAGCARYKTRPLSYLATPVPSQSKEQAVSFSYRIFSKGDCQRYLDRNVLRKGYQPVQITIVNNTSRCLNFSTSNFSLPSARADEVAKTVHTSTIARTTIYSTLAFFTFGLFVIPAVVDGIGSSNAIKQLDGDFAHKTLVDQVINPFSTINGLIFVPVEHFNKEFSLSLTDLDDSKKPFVLSTRSPMVRI